MSRIYHYSSEFTTKHEGTVSEVLNLYSGEDGFWWLDLDEIPSKELLRSMGQTFLLHDLLLEDIENIDDLPKCEVFNEHLFLSLKMIRLSGKEVQVEHTSVILSSNVLITIQSGISGDVFNNIRSRLESRVGYICQRSVDYLFCRVVNAVVEHYDQSIEFYRDQLTQLENLMLNFPDQTKIGQIIDLKNKVNNLRRKVVPLRDEIQLLRNDGHGFFKKEHRNYINDILDHLHNQSESFEHLREMSRDLMDLQHSNLSQVANNIMKTLTVVSAIFIPLTFIAGVYGMNFEVMPELKITWFYPALMGGMLLIALLMAIYMRRKRWF